MARAAPPLPTYPSTSPGAASTTASPLAEIEARVQARAKDLALDLRTPADAASLRSLVDEEMAGWTADYRRGLRPYDLADATVVADRVLRNLTGYGPLEPLLGDDDVWEIMVNAPDAIFVKRHEGLSATTTRSSTTTSTCCAPSRRSSTTPGGRTGARRRRGPPGRPARRRRPHPHRAR